MLHTFCVFPLLHPTLNLLVQRMAAGEAGFVVSRLRKEDDAGLRGKAFYYDAIHPDGNTGARWVGWWSTL